MSKDNLYFGYKSDQHHNHTHSHKVNVTEKRAPTDESIRLLKEMEQEVKQRLISQVEVKNSVFEAVAWALRPMVSASYIEINIHFKVNNQEFHIETKIPRPISTLSSNKNLYELAIEMKALMYRQFSNKIAETLVEFCMKDSEQMPSVLKQI